MTMLFLRKLNTMGAGAQKIIVAKTIANAID